MTWSYRRVRSVKPGKPLSCARLDVAQKNQIDLGAHKKQWEIMPRTKWFIWRTSPSATQHVATAINLPLSVSENRPDTNRINGNNEQKSNDHTNAIKWKFNRKPNRHNYVPGYRRMSFLRVHQPIKTAPLNKQHQQCRSHSLGHIEAKTATTKRWGCG